MYAKHKKQLRPRLDRRNALKNVDYDASQSSASSVDDQPTHRTRSLDLYPLTDRTSFRIDGIDGEFDVICRSLGLSGPEDFAIPAAAWEARRPSSHSDRFADIRRNSDSVLLITNERSDSFGNSVLSDVEDEFNCRLNSSPENVIEVSDSVRNGVRVTDGGELRQGLNSSPENGFKVRASEQEDENFPVDVKCGIRGARPPMLAPPPASEVDNFTSAWEFIKGFGPADDKDTGSPLHDESPSSDLLGNEQVGETVTSDEESNEDFVRSGSQVSEPSVSKSETTDGVRGADEEVLESSSKSLSDDYYSLISKTSSKSPSDDSYSLISKTSSKSPSGVSIRDASNLSSKLMSDESYTLNLKVVNSESPSDSATIKSWQKGDFLGSGSFGTVYEGFTDNGFFFAVKEVSLFDPGNQQSLYQLEQEISLLSQFRHKNIVRYHGTDKDEKNLYIFLELVTKGSLASVYRKYRLRDSHVSDYTRQILSGLRYLHSRNVIHRDIKCANILLDVSGSVKLADFGLAKATKLNDIKSCKGTAFWMAPEVVNRRNNGYGLPADIWSLGCTVLEMLTGQIPYSHLEGMQALFRIGKGEPPPMPDSLSGEAQDFISKCLQVNPRDRPTAAELLEHPFVKKRLPNYSSPAAP